MKAVGIAALIAAWSAGVAYGLAAMLQYELTPEPRPAAEHAASPHWPADARVQLAPDRPTLIAFFHPHCPCSRASLAELTIVADRCRDRVRMHIVFAVPQDDASWEQTSLTQSAHALPQALVAFDREGVEARRFDVQASGEVLLYGPPGRLLFRGGITASRGHEGESAGRSQLLRAIQGAAIQGGAEQPWVGPVYGCPLALSAKD